MSLELSQVYATQTRKVGLIGCRYALGILSPGPSNLGGRPYPEHAEVGHQGTKCLGLVPVPTSLNLV